MTFFESAGAGQSYRAASPWSNDPDDPFTRLRRSRRRRRLAVIGAVVVAAVVAGAGVAVAVGPEVVVTAAGRLLAGQPPVPEADVVAVADRSFLTEEGRRLLYSSRPLIADRAEIAEQCGSLGADGASTLGCYHPLAGIVVYQPADGRIADAAVTTLAHELLHAAYDELGDGERTTVNDLLAVEIARVPADDPVHSQIESSVGEHESSRETELFAYLGSQVRLEGGFAPELEATYARWIADRSALVDVYERVESVIEGVFADADAAYAQLGVDEAANAAQRAQLDVDRRAHEQARTRYNEDADQYNALPADERGSWIATWTTSSGETVSQPLGESLAARLADLEQYRVDLDNRTAALAAAEASVLERRPQVEAQLADVSDLLESAYPGYSAG
jgi:hypothetical protein